MKKVQAHYVGTKYEKSSSINNLAATKTLVRSIILEQWTKEGVVDDKHHFSKKFHFKSRTTKPDYLKKAEISFKTNTFVYSLT